MVAAFRYVGAETVDNSVAPSSVTGDTPDPANTATDVPSPTASQHSQAVFPVFGDRDDLHAVQFRRVTGGSTPPVPQPLAFLTHSSNKPALLIDPGSWDNIAGSKWMVKADREAKTAQLQGTQSRRANELKVSGVGKGHEVCRYDTTVPVSLTTTDGQAVPGRFTAATVEHSELPALLGLKALVNQRAIINFADLTLAFTGPGDSKIDYSPGTEVFQLERSASGHLMLPCTNFSSIPASEKKSLQEQISLLAGEGIGEGLTLSRSSSAHSTSFELVGTESPTGARGSGEAEPSRPSSAPPVPRPPDPIVAPKGSATHRAAVAHGNAVVDGPFTNTAERAAAAVSRMSRAAEGLAAVAMPLPDSPQERAAAILERSRIIGEQRAQQAQRSVYLGMSYRELQRICKSRKLKAVGKTEELVHRLQTWDERELGHARVIGEGSSSSTQR